MARPTSRRAKPRPSPRPLEEPSREMLYGLFNESSDMVAAVDRRGRFLVINPAFREALRVNYGRDARVGDDLVAAFASVPAHARESLVLLKRALRGPPFSARLEIGERTYELSFNAIRDARGRATGVTVIGREVTRGAQAERNLQRMMEDLENRVAERTAALQQADQRKDEFLAMLSHELRNPLAAIRIALYALERSGHAAPQARRSWEIVERQSGHLARLVDALLDVQRLTHGHIELHRAELDLGELVRRAVRDHELIFEEGEVDLEVVMPRRPVHVHGDATRLVQVIANLLSNAARFTPRGGRAHLDLVARGGHAVLTVRDTGVGMGPETLARLFEPFHQAERALARTQSGLGLGLAVARTLVEAHGGSIRGESAGAGRGARFEVRLPLADPKQAAASRRRRILVIEDNRDTAESLRDVLSFGDQEVELAFDGEEGLAKARAFLPDVVLCDIGLPGMNGYDVARALRADERLAKTQLVALTGWAADEDKRQAAAAGFARHVAKPVDLACLERVIAELA